MFRALVATAVALTVSAAAPAQQSPAKPTFDIADIVVAKDTTVPPRGEFKNSHISGFNLTMRLMVQAAWDLQDDKMLAGAPGWFDTDHFDIIAKAPPDTPDAVLKIMLQNLLIERFKLTYHQEPKVAPVYILSVKKDGPKGLQPAAPGNRTNCQSKPNGDGTARRECQNVKMSDLALILPGVASAYVDLPVVDKTGLTAAYDFTLSWTPRARLVEPGADATPNGLTLFEALDRQLGLKLESGKQPLPVMVIDHIERTPTAN